jgi:hypothetical protein
MPFERAVTAHERDPSRSPNRRSPSTSHPCESAKMERGMLLSGKSVASRISHRCCTGGTALLSQRRGLLSEAEEEFRHIRLSRFATAFRATLSCRLLRIQRGTTATYRMPQRVHQAVSELVANTDDT